MTLTAQILLGTALLTFCALVHIGTLILAVPLIERLAKALHDASTLLRNAAMMSLAVFLVVLAHTIQVWAWAIVFHIIGPFEGFAANFYFSTVTYTTLGYGDLVLGEGLRVFGTFASVTGLLTFGISTALLIGLVVRLFPRLNTDDRH